MNQKESSSPCMQTHPEVVVAHPSVLVVGVVNALPAGEQQLLVGEDGKQPSVLGAPGAGSQVLQDCHQQSSVEAVPISCKVRPLSSELTVACISSTFCCFQAGEDCFFHVLVSASTWQCVALTGSAKCGQLVMQQAWSCCV